MSSEASPWLQLERLVRHQDPELLLTDVERLAPVLGLKDRLPELQALPTQQLVSRLQKLIKGRKALRRAERAMATAKRVQRATQRLITGEGVLGLELDVGVLFGELPRHPAKYIGLRLAEAEPFYVARTKLRRVARTLKDRKVTAHLDSAGLHIRWRGGKGGLDLVSDVLSHQDKKEAFLVALSALVVDPDPEPQPQAAPPVPPAPAPHRAPPPAPASPPPSRSRGAWLGDILFDLSLLP